MPNQHILRKRLRAAVELGVILDFTLRPGSRATIYLRNGNKVYTTTALDALVVLRQEGLSLQEEKS
jgi:hypothetical protein